MRAVCGAVSSWVVVGFGEAAPRLPAALSEWSAGGLGRVPRAPQVTRLGGHAVRGQRNREPYPCSDTLSTSGTVATDTTPGKEPVPRERRD